MFSVFNIVFAVLPLAIVAAVVYRGVAVFQKAEGTTFERLLATSRDSATWLWGKVLWVGGWALVGIDNLAILLGQDTVGEAVRNYLPPQIAGFALVAIALSIWWARIRTLTRAE